MFYRVFTNQGVKMLNLSHVRSIECYNRIIRFDYMTFMSNPYTLKYDSEKDAEQEYQKLQDFIENTQKPPQKLE
jgi:hypothetical protein